MSIVSDLKYVLPFAVSINLFPPLKILSLALGAYSGYNKQFFFRFGGNVVYVLVTHWSMVPISVPDGNKLFVAV